MEKRKIKQLLKEISSYISSIYYESIVVVIKLCSIKYERLQRGTIHNKHGGRIRPLTGRLFGENIQDTQSPLFQNFVQHANCPNTSG